MKNTKGKGGRKARFMVIGCGFSLHTTVALARKAEGRQLDKWLSASPSTIARRGWFCPKVEKA